MGNWMLCKLSTGSTIELQRIALRWFRPRSHRSSPHTKTISQQWTSRSMRVACLDDLMICDDIWWTPLVGYVMQHGAVYWDIMKLYSSAKHCVISTHCSTLQKKRSKTATGNVTMIIQWLLQHVQNTALASHQVIGSSSATLKSIAEVNDPWPRTTTCWASILPSDQKGSKSVVWWRIIWLYYMILNIN